ncbi:MAG TPA: hypothetical protein VF210_06265 [Pseudomonadales bacterium]
MDHLIEHAVSGRSRCRACGRAIARGELRFGERLPNPYSDANEMTIWYHPRCAAYRRPEALLSALDGGTALPDADALGAIARRALANPRLTRIAGLERASSGRARCRACREPIARGSLRIPLVHYEEGPFVPSGFVHVACAERYFGGVELLDCIRHFAPDIADDVLSEARAWLC